MRLMPVLKTLVSSHPERIIQSREEAVQVGGEASRPLALRHEREIRLGTLGPGTDPQSDMNCFPSFTLFNMSFF